MQFLSYAFVGSTVVALLVLAPYAHAFAPEKAPADTARSVSPAAAPITVPTPVTRDAIVPVFGVAAAPGLLDSARGGAGGTGASADLRGVVTGNSATSVVTGANTIQASSFAGASGIPIVIQNTGANVLIQNATVINLQFQ